MKTTLTMGLMAGSILASGISKAQDWPQWRGPNRDGKTAAFTPPKTWPKELAAKWKVDVGEGVATPALVGERLYVFSRQNGYEVIRCLEARTGKELWQDQYEALGAEGPARSFSGPRSSPAVAGGKVVTLGVRGMLSCLDAESGKVLWRKDDFQGAVPGFYVSSSPLITEGVCIAQLGGRGGGAIVAYDLSTGQEKWRAPGDSPAYASPVLMTVLGTKLVIAQTEGKMVAVRVADGKVAWESASSQSGGRGGGGGGGGGRDYKAATPIVDGQMIITSGRGSKAVRIEKEGDGFGGKELWSNPDLSVQFNTPVLKNGLLYGLTPGNELFCVTADKGEKLWSASIAGPESGAARGAGGGGGAPGGTGSGRARGGGGGYGSIIDAGAVLMVLTPASQLVVFQPTEKGFTEIARIKVGESQTHAHPVVSGNRIFVKDQNSLSLLAIE